MAYRMVEWISFVVTSDKTRRAVPLQLSAEPLVRYASGKPNRHTRKQRHAVHSPLNRCWRTDSILSVTN